MRVIDWKARSAVLLAAGVSLAAFDDCQQRGEEASSSCSDRRPCDAVQSVALSQTAPVTLALEVDLLDTLVELTGCPGGTWEAIAAEGACVYLVADAAPSSACVGFLSRLTGYTNPDTEQFERATGVSLCPEGTVGGSFASSLSGPLQDGRARLSVRESNDMCEQATVEFRVSCPTECAELPVDESDIAPASALHVAAAPFSVAPQPEAQGVAQQVVACPDDEIVVTPPAGTSVGFTSGGNVRFGIGWDSTVAPPAGGEARFQVAKEFGVQVVVQLEADQGCGIGGTTIDLEAGDGRSYSPDAPVALELDTATTFALHPLTPIFFSLPPEQPRSFVLSIGGALVESGLSVDLGVGRTVGGVPQCDPNVAVLCTGSLQGEPTGAGTYRPIIVEIPADVEGELFLDEGESVLKSLEEYDDCPEVTVMLSLAPVADAEDCDAVGDEDDDGLADCDDPACIGEPACETPDTELACDNGLDDDDGLIDCGDDDCEGDEACAGCPDAADVDVTDATLVDTTGMLNNFICFEDTCGGVLASFWDEIGAAGSEILYGYSAPFAAPGITVPLGVDVQIRQYPPADMFAETGTVACVGDRFFNYGYQTTVEAPATPISTDTTPLVVFAGLQPDEFGPPYRFPADSTCPDNDCTDLLPRFFVLEEPCDPSPGAAMIRVFNASPRKRSVTVRVTPRPDGAGAPFELVSGLGWGEASDWVALTPTVGSGYFAEWSFVDGVEEFENVLGYFPRVDRTAAEIPFADTCSTLVVAYNEREPEREHAFLVMESPQVCSFWRNRDGDPTSTWPECE